MTARQGRHPVFLGVPVGTNVALVALAAARNDGGAVAAAVVASIMVTGAIVLHVRAADRDNERISYLQTTVPTLVPAFDADTVVNLVPKPSPIVGQVLRQLRPVGSVEVADRPLLTVVPIDRS
jgi:hypothetical protein